MRMQPLSRSHAFSDANDLVTYAHFAVSPSQVVSPSIVLSACAVFTEKIKHSIFRLPPVWIQLRSPSFN
jgi:hypothetical protein